jgi:hypothetical protein
MTGGRGYEERQAGRIPDFMEFRARLVGGKEVATQHAGKILYRMTEETLREESEGLTRWRVVIYIIPLVCQIERGLIRSIEIWAGVENA